MHYFHLFLSVVLPFSLGVGILGTMTALMLPMDNPSRPRFAQSFLSVQTGRLAQFWSEYVITFVYFFLGIYCLLMTSWHDVGNWLCAMAVMWVIRNWLCLKFPKRTYKFEAVRLSFKDGKLTCEVK